VAQVVHYAHQKHVVHRDLKVDNILVTPDGVVKLVDFGIAKRFDPESPQPPTQTVTAQRLMTLLYSSPEQVRGEEITPASDVYSLGVVLYKLLADASPYAEATGDNPYALTRAICDTEPLPPSRAATAPLALRRRLRGDLDAVVMMALRKDPSRRYASAEAMSEDLFRHLEGLPVQARRGAWSYRAGRFVLRHRVAMAAVMAVNLALVAGIAVASHEAWRADQQRERAERHFAALHRLAHVFIFDVHDAIQNLPGSTAARKLVVQTALSYLTDLGAEAAGDPALQVEVAAGYRKVGDILGRPHVANLGDPQGALAEYGQARTRLMPLAQTTAAASEVGHAARLEYATTLLREGGLLFALGRYKEAEAKLRATLDAAASLPTGEAATPGDRVLRASGWLKLAEVEFDANEMDDYARSAVHARTELDELLAHRPDDPDAMLQKAVAQDLEGWYLFQRDGSRASGVAALDAFRRSAETLERLHAIAPERADVTRKLAGERANVATALSRVGDVRGSNEELRQSIALLAGLAAKDPGDMDSRGAQALVTHTLAESQRELGELDASVASAHAALSLFDQLAAGARLDVSMRSAMGAARNTLAAALDARAGLHPRSPQAAADRREACQRWAEALDILQALDDTGAAAPGKLGPAEVRQAMAPHCAAG